ncbi:ABC transporter permease [Stomatohabitans albus]|uniref:ABC transporter permease n=1 Tax=Stomatohabitans albus TaxID=3110766 RepID=UPI00300CE44E
MNTIILASIRQHRGRFIATGIAIVLAVAFVVTGFVVTSSYAASFANAFNADMTHADIRIGLDDGPSGSMEDEVAQTKAITQRLSQHQDVESVYSELSNFASFSANGSEDSATIFALPPEPLRWQELVSGSWPSQPGQAVISTNVAERHALSTGSRISLRPFGEETAKTTDLTIVGTYALQNGAPASEFYVSQETFDQLPGTPLVHGTLVKGVAGTSPDQLATTLTPTITEPGFVVKTKEAVANEQVEELSGSTITIQAIVLAFGAISIIVAGFVIANTFRLIVAQRTKELALMRCVGATKGQIRKLILGESAVIGLSFSVLGALIGIGVAYLIKMIAGAGELQISEFVVSPTMVIISLLLGTASTVLFAMGPARNALRVHPIAALRPQTQEEERRSSVVIGIIGTILAVIGTGAMVAFSFTELLPVAILAGMVSAIGVLMVSRLCLPPMIHGIGRLIAPLNATTELAVANTTRNRQRTAATGTALLIGAVLLTMLSTGITSTRESVLKTIDQKRPLDLVVQTREDVQLTPANIQAVGAVNRVEKTATMYSATAKYDFDQFVQLESKFYATDPAELNAVLHDPVPPLAPDTVYTNDAELNNLENNGQLVVTTERGEKTLTVREDPSIDPGILVVSYQTLQSFGSPLIPERILVRLPRGLSFQEIEEVQRDIGKVIPNARVYGGAMDRAMLNQVLDVILYVLLALLAVSVIIAIVGVGNTAALSILERRHESAMLRAVGITRSQLVNMITTEAVLAAVVSVVFGIVLGIGYAWSGVIAIDHAADKLGLALHIPWLSIMLIIVGTLLAGLLASYIPALRAAKRSIVTDLAST